MIKRFLKLGSNRNNNENIIFQPEAYELAEYLAIRSGAAHIIYIGVSSTSNLTLHNKSISAVVVESRRNIKKLKSIIPNALFIESNFENGIPKIDEDIVKSSIIISTGVIEGTENTDKYLSDLATLSQHCRYVILTSSSSQNIKSKLDKLGKNKTFDMMSGYTVNTSIDSKKSTQILLFGSDIYKDKTPADLPLKNVQAILTLYNEEEIIGQVLEHLTNQGLAVHVIDNWSNDKSYEIVTKMTKRNKQITYEKFPVQKPEYYEWAEILKQAEKVAQEGLYDWYMLYDADELRISPWPVVPLRQAISFVDGQGYNAIDFTVLDFRPTKDGFDGSQSLASYIDFYEFGKRPGHFTQVKAWKNTGKKVDISNSGGHEAVFEGRKIYPIKFINKHYPLRSTAQARRKVFADRLPRLSPAEKKKGWHIQYNSFDKESEFIWPKESLIQFSRYEFYSKYIVELISGIGINR